MSVTIKLLDETDTIKKTDWMRPLNTSASQSTYSDGWDSTHDYMRWRKVGDILGECWWGKKYAEYLRINDGSRYNFAFEFVRGRIPSSHTEVLVETDPRRVWRMP